MHVMIFSHYSVCAGQPMDAIILRVIISEIARRAIQLFLGCTLYKITYA